MYGANGELAPELSEERILRLEEELSCKLPADYRDFLKDYGGCLFSNTWRFPLNNTLIEHGGVSLFFGVFPQIVYGADLFTIYKNACDSDWQTDIFSGLMLIRKLEEFEFTSTAAEETTWVMWPAELLPIADSGGNDMTCIILSGEQTGHIYYWINAPDPMEPNIYHVANSFGEFVRMLY